MTHSALYEGTIRHRRFAVRRHELRHRISMAYLDLDELPRLLGGRLVRAAPGARPLPPRRLPRRPRASRSPTPSASSSASRCRRSACSRNLRTLGHCFNPVSFYYCFDDAENLDAVVAEVTNTPWGERHAYVLDEPAAPSTTRRCACRPSWAWTSATPSRSRRPDRRSRSTSRAARTASRAFDATLKLHRRPLTARLGALRTLPLIYGHALVLRAKGVRPR